MKKVILALSSMIVLNGCATDGNFISPTDGWMNVGRSPAQLMYCRSYLDNKYPDPVCFIPKIVEPQHVYMQRND